jgi:hypothetical protein
MLSVTDLEALKPSDYAATRETDQHTKYHALFYRNISTIEPLYRLLLHSALGDKAGQFYVQKVPTFRVHLRNSRAVGTWHRDREFGHDPSEVNYWVPLTRAFGSNTLWIENTEVPASYGDIIVFDGANLLHGNEINDTDISRVSLDFRTIPRARYQPREDRSVSYRLRFRLGEYWDEP